MKAFYALLFLACTAFTACERCEQNFEINQNMRLLAQAYQPGSWWIYANQDSTKFDSVYVTNKMGWDYEPITRTKCLINEQGGTFDVRGDILDTGTDPNNWDWSISCRNDANDCQLILDRFDLFNFISDLETDESNLYTLTNLSERFTGTYKDSVVNNLRYKHLVVDSANTPIIDLEKGLLIYTIQQDTFRLVNSSLFEL